jgi:dTDP-L-rhamnose 4-epimerase
VDALSGVDSVVHLAAYQDYLPDFSHFFDTNSVGTALLYEVIVAKGLKIQKVVVASSQATYGEAKYECLNLYCPLTEKSGSATRFPGPRENAQLQAQDWGVRCPACDQSVQWVLTDERKTNPHNSYAISKYTQEMIALNLGERYGIPTACLRYSIVQGPRQSFRNAYSGILRIFSQRVLSGQRPVCYEDAGQVRDYISVLDAAQATVLALESDQSDLDVFNVGGDRAVTVLQYARLVAEAAGVDVEPSIPGIYRFGDTRHVVSSVRKLKSLGWQPEISMEAVVDDYLEWATSQPDFKDYSSDAEREMLDLGTLRQAAAGT